MSDALKTHEIHGEVAPGFEPVADAFRDNFSIHNELGAAFAAYSSDRKLVDLWGGVADASTGRPWQEDTLQLIFSGTKGLTAGCVLLMLDGGQLDLTQPVAHYWPEFGSEGKEELAVAELVSHRAGLAALLRDVHPDEILDPPAMADLLAHQRPRWAPNERAAYHALTIGWLCDALARRVTGKSIGGLFDEAIRAPLELEAWIGLPSGLEARVSRLTKHASFKIEEPLADHDFAKRIYYNPPLFDDPLLWNDLPFQQAEIAAVNGIATARSMAKYYGCLANEGALGSVRVWSKAAAFTAPTELARGIDPYSGEEIRFGAGFELQTSERRLGPEDDAFGHTGAGGSTHGAWPKLGVGFSYAMNEMRDDLRDERGRRLLRALHDCLSG